jgi:ferrous iron transport protein B
VVALVGNPNTGKSTLFGALTGLRQRVGNYPGVTIEVKHGRLRVGGHELDLVDLPGTYSLRSRSPDEKMVEEVLEGLHPEVAVPDLIVCVVDASNLERNLYLVDQLRELGLPVIVALTMIDLAAARGLHVDLRKLSDELGLPVVAASGRTRGGLDALRALLGERAGEVGSAAEGGGRVATPRNGRVETADQTQARYDWITRVVDEVVNSDDATARTMTDRIDAVLTHRVWGLILLSIVTVLVFQAVFSWAEAPMGWIESGLGLAASGIESWLPEGTLRSLLIEGVIGGIGTVLLFLPQIVLLFAFLAVLEESGYLARAAFLLDRMMVGLGLSGKSFIPLLSSFACAVPGIMATRVVEDRRDRLATILIAPLMSCSARLPVYALMIAAFIPSRRYLGGLVGLQSLTLFALYALGIVTAMGVALVLRGTMKRRGASGLMLELPAYRWPSPRMVVVRVVERAWDFLAQAGTMILAIAIVMWAGLSFPRLPAGVDAAMETRIAALEREREAALASSGSDEAAVLALEERIEAERARREGMQRRGSLLGRAGRWIEPAVRPLGWDWRIATAVLASFPAREVVVATMGVIFDVGSREGSENRLAGALKEATWPDGRALFTIPVALSIAVFFALCAQCVSTLVVIKRETRSWVWPLVSFTYMTVLAYLAALATYQVGTWLAG